MYKVKIKKPKRIGQPATVKPRPMTKEERTKFLKKISPSKY